MKETTKASALDNNNQPEKSGKNLFIAIVAAVLVVVMILAIALSGKSGPEKAFDALMKTAFSSSRLVLDVSSDKEQSATSVDVVLREGLDDSTIEYITKYESYSQKILIDNGKISLYGLEYDIDELMADVEKRTEFEQYGIELSALEIVDTLINGKIDEKEFEKLFNNYFVPNAEAEYEEKYGAAVELPDYKTTVKIIEKFLKKGITKAAVQKGKTTSSSSEKTYNYTVDVYELAKCVGEFSKKDKDIRKCLEAIVEASDGKYADIDALVADYVAGYENAGVVKLQISIFAGRISEVIIDDGNEVTTIVVDSAR